jgi:hypothetical protein
MAGGNDATVSGWRVSGCVMMWGGWGGGVREGGGWGGASKATGAVSVLFMLLWVV